MPASAGMNAGGELRLDPILFARETSAIRIFVTSSCQLMS